METIVASATPNLISAIHIIRISGDDAYKIINKISKAKISKIGYRMQRTIILDKDKEIDDVIILKYLKPKSYTGEDMIEICCHGSPFITKKIIELLIKNGCRYAKNGEFTKRSYLNNKISLSKAKAINNMIKTNSELPINVCNNFFKNKLDEQIKKITEYIFNILGKMEVNIDYPEYDDFYQSKTEISKKIKSVINKLNLIIKSTKRIIPYFDGIKIAIVGKPNVGKSSLMNALLNEQKVIVSPTPGTTRDIISHSVLINGILYNFLDTAGIYKTKDKIENLGINLSKEAIRNADLIFFVIDGSKKDTKEDNEIFNFIKNKNYIIVNNKTDLKQVKKNYKNFINISAKNNDIENLIK
jgi:tRNA modification GTPase